MKYCQDLVIQGFAWHPVVKNTCFGGCRGTMKYHHTGSYRVLHDIQLLKTHVFVVIEETGVRWRHVSTSHTASWHRGILKDIQLLKTLGFLLLWLQKKFSTVKTCTHRSYSVLHNTQFLKTLFLWLQRRLSTTKTCTHRPYRVLHNTQLLKTLCFCGCRGDWVPWRPVPTGHTGSGHRGTLHDWHIGPGQGTLWSGGGK